MLKLLVLVLDCSHLHHQFDRGRQVIRFLGKSYIFDKYSLRPFGSDKKMVQVAERSSSTKTDYFERDRHLASQS